METEAYTTENPWVGEMTCPECSHTVLAWRSSGMSDLWPHFYCDRCSNAIQREADKQLAWDHLDAETVEKIAATLPECPCGGRFAPGTNPKCPKCGFEFAHQGSAVERLSDPHVILIDGACFFGDKEPYRVRITEA